MKRILILMVLFLFGLFSWANGGKKPTPPPGEEFVEEPPYEAPVDMEPVEEVLERLITLIENAVNSGDSSLLEPNLDPDFTAVLPTGEQVLGFGGLRVVLKGLEESLGDGEYRVTFHPDTIEVDGELATARGVSEETIRSAGGGETRLQTPWTMTFNKRGGAWRLSRFQGTLDPVDNPFAAKRLWNAKLLFGGIGLCIGLFLGLLVGIVIRSLFSRPKAAEVDIPPPID